MSKVNMNKNREYILHGLNCSNCAAKIENEVNKLEGVEEASINLMNNKLSIKLRGESDEGLFSSISRIVKSHEPSVRVIDRHSDIQSKDDDINDTNANANTNSKANSIVNGGNLTEEDEEKPWPYILRLLAALVITGVFYFLKLPLETTTIAYVIAYLLAGYEILINAGRNIIKGKIFDENFLMAAASLGALLIGERVEAVTVLVFYGVGELLQDMAVNRSKKNIAELMDIRPDYANLITDDGLHVISPDQVKVNSGILIKPGEKIPLDGVVIKGNSFVDARALTGESVPVRVGVGDTVLSGTINTNGVIEVKVTRPFSEGTVTRILELVANTGSKKAESEKFITKFARYYTPIVVFAAIGVALLPPILGLGTFSNWIYRALSFLIISCPCALVISIPLSFFGGIGGAARQGILIKGGNYLDSLNHIDTLAFDKTGTLTKGVFEVTKLSPVKGVSKEELLRLAVIAESQSTHPIATSIISYYQKNRMKLDKSIIGHLSQIPVDITEKSGLGIIARLSDGMVYAGNVKLMSEIGIKVEASEAANSVVHIAYNGNYMGYILVSDEIKPDIKNIIKELKSLGIRRTLMLTGDRKEIASQVAANTGIDEYMAELLPHEKLAKLKEMVNSDKGIGKIAFVGDGINDAPVLVGADIGIAMGGIGSDAAIEAADIVIMNDDISKIVTGIKIARKTRSIVIQNIVFALVVKLLIMILAFFGITSIWFAIFADVGVALIALINSMRAMRVK